MSVYRIVNPIQSIINWFSTGGKTGSSANSPEPNIYSKSSGSADRDIISKLLAEPDYPTKEVSQNIVYTPGSDHNTAKGVDHPITPKALPYGVEWKTGNPGGSDCQEIIHPAKCEGKCKTGYTKLGGSLTTSFCHHHNSRITLGLSNEPYLLCKLNACYASSTLLSEVGLISNSIRMYWKPLGGRRIHPTSKDSLQGICETIYPNVRCEAGVYYGYYFKEQIGTTPVDAADAVARTNGNGKTNGQWSSVCSTDNQ